MVEEAVLKDKGGDTWLLPLSKGRDLFLKR
jgi:hypothetical protein